MAAQLEQCPTDGSGTTPNQYLTCATTAWTEHDLSFCECAFCQQYSANSIPQYSVDNKPPDCDYTKNDPACRNEVAMTTLTPGIAYNQTLCLNHWTFFALPTTPPTQTQAWRDPDTVEASSISAQLGSQPSNPQQLILTLDTQYDALVDRFSTVDAFVHTSEVLPDNWYNVHKGTEETNGAQHAAYPAVVWTPDLPPNNLPDLSHYVDFSQRDSFTYTVGYDPSDATCNKQHPSQIFLAVRCGNPSAGSIGSWNRQNQPCRFTVRYLLVPQHLKDGDVLGPLPIAPLTTHAYSVQVGGYDVLRIAFRRIGQNLTAFCMTDGVEDCLPTNPGVIGTVFSSVGMCPTLGTTTKPLLNSTQVLRREWFCTVPGEEGRYHVALTAGEVFDPEGPIPGYVMHDGSNVADGTDLVANPGGTNNQVKPMRGYYTVTVYHKTYLDGNIGTAELAAGRIGCISFGQMRRFTVVTTGAADASLYLSAVRVDEYGTELVDEGMPLSALYVRRNKPPTKSAYDVATFVPSSSLSTSPCDVDQPYEYHLATYLSPELRAVADGLKPCLFKLVPVLLSAAGPTYATAAWPSAFSQAVVPLETPRFLGGGGHVCCKQIRYWVVRGVPADVEPVVYLNVSAVIVKRGTCPAASDLLSDHSGCVGRCSVGWLAKYNPYSGQATYLPSASVSGGFAPLGYEDGLVDWYVAVQGLRDEPAEFELYLSSRPRAAFVRETVCTRLSHFCPTAALLGSVNGSAAGASGAGTVASTALPHSAATSSPRGAAAASPFAALALSLVAFVFSSRSRR